MLWFAGDMFSIADIAVMSQMMNLILTARSAARAFPLCGRIMSVALRGLPSPMYEQNNAFIEKAGFQMNV